MGSWPVRDKVTAVSQYRFGRVAIVALGLLGLASCDPKEGLSWSQTASPLQAAPSIPGTVTAVKGNSQTLRIICSALADEHPVASR